MRKVTEAEARVGVGVGLGSGVPRLKHELGVGVLVRGRDRVGLTEGEARVECEGSEGIGGCHLVHAGSA